MRSTVGTCLLLVGLAGLALAHPGRGRGGPPDPFPGGGVPGGVKDDSRGGVPVSAPEIDGSLALNMLALVSGAVLMARSGRKR